MHWADVIANKLVEINPSPIIATGITPSGVIHVGSLRESITAEAVRSAVEEKGNDVKLIYLIDAFDPLRKRYEFLPEEYENHVGKPICNIPCPCGKHASYAEHYIEPFLDALKSAGVKYELHWTNQLYAQGKFAEMIDSVINRRKEISKILFEVSGKEEKEDFSPYQPLCEKCGVFIKTPDYSKYQYPYLEYTCPCGHCGKADIRLAQGKLGWRFEWPAKWKIFGTTAEPFGKDHGAAGGSYDSGVRIADEIYGIKAPYPIRYEFVQLKVADPSDPTGQRSVISQMHKSKGSSITGMDAISMMPPEVLNYLFLRLQPNTSIDYDSGMGVIDISEEYDKMENAYFTNKIKKSDENAVRAYVLAQHNNVPSKLPLQVSCRHMINVVQLADTFEERLKVLGRTVDLSAATEEDLKKIEKRFKAIEYWVKEDFAPSAVQFKLNKDVPADFDLSDDAKVLFKDIAARLKECEWEAKIVNKALSDASKESPVGKDAYPIIYNLFVGMDKGPRLGMFFASMERDFVVNMFEKAAQ
ncbi:MAG: lysine--tRNA ligase [archaeon]|nr:lysine--tRNA ligase [archaeon]